MLRPAASLLAFATLLTCGAALGSPSSFRSTQRSAASPAPTLEALWRSAKQNVAITPGTTDYEPGRNRISFLVIDSKGRAITTPSATVWVGTGLKAHPFMKTTARSEPIGVPGGASAGVGSIFVATVTLPKAKTYWMLAAPVGENVSIRALGNLAVRAKASAPAVGARAIASKTPTLASTGGELAKLSTATHPDPRLYRISIVQALARRVPFVATFATPRFCQSRTCGPVVDVVDAVARRESKSNVRFIHVEIYKDNDPAKGTNRWVEEWHLPTEPFTFVVDSKGIIRTKLEGAFSVGELQRAVRAVAR
jgi:hypothetical protein